MYDGLLIFGLALSSAVILTKLQSHGLSALAYDPAILFSLYFAIIHFLTPLLKYQNGLFRYQSGYDESVLIYSSALSVVFFIFAVGVSNIYVRRTYAIINRRPVAQDWSARGAARIAYRTAISIAIFGAFFAWRDLSNIQSTVGGIASYLSDRHYYSEGRSLTRIFVNFLIPASTLLLAVIVTQCRRLPAFLMWASVNTALIYYSFFTSSRNTILILLILNIATFYFFRAQTHSYRRKRKMFSVALIAIAIAAAGWVTYRTTVQRYSVSDSSYMQKRRNDIIFYMLDGAFGNNEARLWMIQHGQPYYYGETYLAGITAIVPRAIWPEKPLGAGPRLINMIRPGSYVPGQTGNNSLTTGLVVEGRMNFGLPGVFLALAAWAYLANRTIRAALRSHSYLRRVMFITISISLSTSLLYSEFLGFVARLGVIIAPLYLAELYFRSRRKQDYRALQGAIR